jgi:hypothetical protein
LGLSNSAQAVLMGLSGFFMALGTAGATLPGFLPDNVKAPFAIFFWISGIVGFALKEALGSIPPPASSPSAPGPSKA